MTQKFTETHAVLESIRSSPHNDKKKLHTKLYFSLINDCMDKIQLEDVFELMPDERRLREGDIDLESFSKFMHLNQEILTNKNFDLELSDSEKTRRDFMDLEIDKMEKEELEMTDSQMIGDSNIIFFKGKNLVSLSLWAIFLLIAGFLAYGIYYLLNDGGKKSLKKPKKDKKKEKRH